MTTAAATLTGLSAIVMWSLLAALTVATGNIPPFELAAITFAIGGLTGVMTWLWRPHAARAMLQPPVAWAVGVGGLFGYHALYFIALRLAPPAEAGLFNYLWPLLIVLLSALLPGERLSAHHLFGAVLGLSGTALLLLGNGASLPATALPGFLAAFCAAFVWAGYSVLSRRLKSVPTDAVTGFCLATALLALGCHLLFERTVWPAGVLVWTCLVALGIGPVGIAFYTWDIGMKRGDIRLIGALSYATPLLSTGFLVLAGFAQPSTQLGLAALLIAGGGLIAARDVLRLRPRQSVDTKPDRL